MIITITIISIAIQWR